MNQQIVQSLRGLRLSGMAKAWKELAESHKIHELTLLDGMELLLQHEQDERQNNRFIRLLRNARFRYQASLEEVNYDPLRGINKGQINELSTCKFIQKGESILISGATGCGKSYLASALGHQACMKGYKVLYFNTHKFMQKVRMARAEGSAIKYFDKIASTSVLILDDFGLTQLDKQQQYDLMEVIEDRHAKLSTIIVSQLPVENWYNVFTDATIADAILDRLVHTAHRFELKGESLRKNMK